MTEEMKYYTGNCITDLHTDTSISSNEEKCKQYIKSDGLNFCMSSVCPEKDCIYALVNKLHQKIDCLEQENEKLKEANKKMYQSMHKEICEYDEELGIEKASRESDLETLDTYRSALEEIKSWAGQLYYHAIKNPVKREQTIDKIQQKCNKVLK